MARNFEIRTDDDGRTLCVRGELDLASAPTLQRELDAAVASGKDDLIVDLSDCGFIDTAGIQLLISCRDRLAQMGRGGVSLRAPGPQARRILDLVGIDDRLATSGHSG